MEIGVVVIGRNEGERLRRCLESALGSAERLVYVDSGSTDGSAELARSLGAEVVELDMSVPFTAARARNAGFRRLLESASRPRYVQFVDGDCELRPGWLDTAREALEQRQALAAVAGRLRERSPAASIYNRLGELEWNFAGIGDVGSVGGIFMVRADVFDEVGGFDTSIAAGEEPELCQRLTRAGWIITRLDVDMAVHDLAMSRFGQWWKRQIRSGYGGLDVANRFDLPRFRRNNARVRFWSAWPLLVGCAGMAAGLMAGPLPGWLAAFAVFALWPVQMTRIGLRILRQGQPPRVALGYAFFTMVSFWPQMLGQVRYMADRIRNRSPGLIEYKAVARNEVKAYAEGRGA